MNAPALYVALSLLALFTPALIWAAIQHRRAKAYFAGRRDQAAGAIDRRRSGAYVHGVIDEALLTFGGKRR